ncbi:ABC transporter ATP-binding protein [Synoicihabitans lomoniglobus]|uniref:Energy-coupling factor transporter ATPase n=1 Tax=Synoicihabitans lomoniglobus TaxID=2909285 RepID=A0AAF0CRH0_9BACT|nr:energy-coupling factor transporter ATPase [Opitutaceae bacterium LMO-M01]WED66621.1 energy-coupling factor transporter ATPase [Opitutaceae bacterium LMO-M01]
MTTVCTAPLVSFRQVSYAYPRSTEPVLRDITLDIAPGEIIGLLGPSGAGKTTLCLALTGIVPQFYRGRFFGHLTVAAHDTLDHPIHSLSQAVGLVLQDPESQLVTASVEHEVAFALENAGLPVAEIHERVARALAAVYLTDCAHKHPHDLSGGQQQRLALAAALALRPPLIVLDEPTSQLDPASTTEVFRLVRELNATHGTTFVIASHASEEMATYVDRAIVLDAGRIVADGPASKIFAHTALFSRLHLRLPEVTATFLHLQRGGEYPANATLPVTHAAGLAAIQTLPPAHAFTLPPAAPPDRGVPILELRNVTHTYADGTTALRGIDVQIPRGEYCLIIGQNGAGKSTLLKHFLNLLQPTSGEALIDGVPLRDFKVSALAQRIGYVPQNPDRQLFNATVEAEVGFSLQATNLDPAARQARLDEALEAMQLVHLRHAHPFSLSKGDRARVVIAAVLALKPEVLVFDEPTTGQDAAGARAILDLTQELHALGHTIVIVTHHLYLMPDYAHRVLVMGHGQLLLDAPIRDAFHAIDVLASTSVAPTQAVALARASHPDNRALTPAELALSFAPPRSRP